MRPLVRLSVIDLLWPADMPKLITELEPLGYSRYWATEHHGPNQSASPRLMAALGAGLTESMRVGTGGVMLRGESPLRVAEDFLLLEHFFEGRIDVGIISTLPQEPLAAQLLDGRPRPNRDEFERRIEKLVNYLRTGEAEGVALGPSVRSVPQFWLCGMSSESATMAGRLGVGYAYHHYISQQLGWAEDGASVLSEYRRSFRPSLARSEPEALIACYGMCAGDTEEATLLWRNFFESPESPFESPAAEEGPTSPGHVPRASFLGDAQECRRQLLLLASQYQVDELLIQCMCLDLAPRLDAYRRIAKVLRLAENHETGP